MLKHFFLGIATFCFMGFALPWLLGYQATLGAFVITGSNFIFGVANLYFYFKVSEEEGKHKR